MEYKELDDLITSTYKLPRPYEVLAYEELHNDSSKTWAFKKKPLDEWAEADIRALKETGKVKHWRTATIMQDMVNNGVLPEGNFLVEVFW